MEAGVSRRVIRPVYVNLGIKPLLKDVKVNTVMFFSKQADE